MKDESENHRVGGLLLPSILVFEKRDEGVYASGKMLPFLLEELVSRGISEIFVFDRWRYEEILPELPVIFSKILHFADDAEDRALSAKIFLPFFEEFGIETDKHLSSFRFRSPPRPENETAAQAAMVASIQIPNFLTAMREKTHCHFDVLSLLANLDRMLTKSRSSEMRANIAVLKGVFSNYRETTYGSLKARTNSTADMIGLFEELLEHAKYKSLSREVGKLGSTKIALATTTHHIARVAKDIVQSKVAKGVYDFGATVITTATHIPLPKSDLADSLISEKYFPPIVDMSSAIKIARANMVIAHPDRDFIGESARPNGK